MPNVFSLIYSFWQARLPISLDTLLKYAILCFRGEMMIHTIRQVIDNNNNDDQRPWVFKGRPMVCPI